MKQMLVFIFSLALMTGCSEKPAENSAANAEPTPRSLSGDNNYDGPNPHANLSAEQHVEVAKQHFEQGRPVEAQEVLTSAGAGTGWRGDIIALVSAKRFDDARERMKAHCVEGKNSEVCLILASAYFDAEANFAINSKNIVEAYRYTKLACDYGSADACPAAKAAMEGGELLQNVLFEPGIENRDAQLKQALKLGADLNATTLFTATLLQQAISEENIDAVKLLLANSVDVNFRITDEDPTPLIYAINSGNTNMTLLLLDNGADPSRKMKVPEYLQMEKAEADACDFAHKLANNEMISPLKCTVASAAGQ